MNATEIGKKLKKAREEKGYSILEAARQTRIRDRYVEALEAGKWETFATQAQVRGFVRNYAAFLELDAKELLSPRNQTKPTTEDAAAETKVILGDPSKKEFAQIGKQLKERRDVLGLSLEEVEGQTRIGERFLQWIENGDFDAFPSPTQARGMLNNYASFLGLEREVLEQYGKIVHGGYQEEALTGEQMPPHEVAPALRKPLRMPNWMRRYLSFDILAGVVLTSVLLGVFLWGVGQVASLSEAEQIPPTAPPLAELLLPTSSPTVEVTAVPSNLDEAGSGNVVEDQPIEDVPQITIQVANPSSVDLTLIASQREWMRVSVDGQIRFEGRTLPGETYNFTGNNEVIVYTGNAAAFRVVLNNQDLGPLGIEGEVIEMFFTRTGAATPSPTVAPTIDPIALTATAEAAVDEATPEP